MGRVGQATPRSTPRLTAQCRPRFPRRGQSQCSCSVGTMLFPVWPEGRVRVGPGRSHFEACDTGWPGTLLLPALHARTAAAAASPGAALPLRLSAVGGAGSTQPPKQAAGALPRESPHLLHLLEAPMFCRLRGLCCPPPPTTAAAHAKSQCSLWPPGRLGGSPT